MTAAKTKTVNNRVRKTPGEIAFIIFNYIFITAFTICALYPFINVIATSFSSSRAVSSGEVNLIPIEFNLDAYDQLLLDGQIFRAIKNTIILTGFGTLINLVATTLAAYTLSKKRLFGRGFFIGMIVFTMLFSGGMIPDFILMKSLNLIDSYTGLWLQGLISTYNMIVMKTFFEALPISLEEAASIDGANDATILFRIILPLSIPIMATMVLFYAVGWWNSYMGPMLYLSSTAKYPLMLTLKQMLDTAQQITIAQESGEGLTQTLIAPETFKAATIVVSTLPIICVYPFLQKYFVKGVMVGSVKG
ncbi:MAG: carbohydrate ABC transporter permease [Candidatus Merdivicinus sp.]|jgi:putative aldouronate transport system permease protein